MYYKVFKLVNGIHYGIQKYELSWLLCLLTEVVICDKKKLGLYEPCQSSVVLLNIKNILTDINNAESEKYMHTSIQIKINIYFENHK